MSTHGQRGRPPLCPDHVLDRVLDLRISGLSYRSICKALNADQVPTPGGRANWGPTHICRLLATRNAKDRKAFRLRSTEAPVERASGDTEHLGDLGHGRTLGAHPVGLSLLRSGQCNRAATDPAAFAGGGQSGDGPLSNEAALDYVDNSVSASRMQQSGRVRVVRTILLDATIRAHSSQVVSWRNTDRRNQGTAPSAEHGAVPRSGALCPPGLWRLVS
ncbi:hypothetical protein ABIC28_003458 [Rhodococcus sp. PvR044]